MPPTEPSFATAFGALLTQAEVDFVIPDLIRDIPVCIDPFLLYKSRDDKLRDLHARLLGVFTKGSKLFLAGDRPGLDRLIDFPEVGAIGFGYARSSTRGSGLGWHLNQLLAELLSTSEPIRERGIRHVEELQLLSVGVGADRISDIAANALKLPLVEYTQEQAALWSIPVTKGVPLPHYLDQDDLEWRDGYFDLPVNPVSGGPLLLVPRRIVRLLPWINYQDFYATEARSFLPAKAKLPRYPGMTQAKSFEVAKQELVTRVRQEPAALEHYVARKEREGSGAVPVLHDEPDTNELRVTADRLLARLQGMATGSADAADYQRLVYEILNLLFEPQLTSGQFEVGTYLGTERRDLIYWNEAEHSFWDYVRGTYKSPVQMFECKNVATLSIDNVNQTATYLGARLGMFGVIVTRNAVSEAIERKLFSVYNDSPALPRKVILVLYDADLEAMLAGPVGGQPPTTYVQNLYRAFRQRAQ